MERQYEKRPIKRPTKIVLATCICGVAVVVGIGGVLFYKHWQKQEYEKQRYLDIAEKFVFDCEIEEVHTDDAELVQLFCKERSISGTFSNKQGVRLTSDGDVEVVDNTFTKTISAEVPQIFYRVEALDRELLEQGITKIVDLKLEDGDTSIDKTVEVSYIFTKEDEILLEAKQADFVAAKEEAARREQEGLQNTTDYQSSQITRPSGSSSTGSNVMSSGLKLEVLGVRTAEGFAEDSGVVELTLRVSCNREYCVPGFVPSGGICRDAPDKLSVYGNDCGLYIKTEDGTLYGLDKYYGMEGVVPIRLIGVSPNSWTLMGDVGLIFAMPQNSIAVIYTAGGESIEMSLK